MQGTVFVSFVLNEGGCRLIFGAKFLLSENIFRKEIGGSIGPNARVIENSFDVGEVVSILSVRSPFKQSLQKCLTNIQCDSMSRSYY